MVGGRLDLMTNRCAIIFSTAFAALISLVCCLGISSSFAQDIRVVDGLVWKSDKVTGDEIAMSRGDSSINFVDVGDLSYYSMYLVQEALGSIADAAGKTVDRSLKNVAIVIVHDTNVFSRLKTDRDAFGVLGIPDLFINELQKRAAADSTMKCINISTDDKDNNVALTTILISEKFDSCLTGGLFRAFGVDSLNTNIKSLGDVCLLYEGRKLGLRDRQSLTREMPKLRDLCASRLADGK